MFVVPVSTSTLLLRLVAACHAYVSDDVLANNQIHKVWRAMWLFYLYYHVGK